MPKVSIVIPVYNVKNYLEKCVHSVLDQTEKDFELLLVDDGSTDESGKLCDALAETDLRIRVIHQKNQGLGGARNTGIREAKGQWLLLVDSDDWIEPEVLEKTLEAGERENADMVMFGFRTVNERGEPLRSFTESLPKHRALSLREHREILFTAPCAWNKLYRTGLFAQTGVEYPLKVWYEDVRTTPKLMAAATSLVFLDYIGYNYLQRPGSIMNNMKIGRNVEILEAFDDLLPYFRENGLFEEYRDELCYLTLYHAYLTASVRVLRLDRKHPLLSKFAAYIRESFPDYRENRYLSRLTRNEKLLFFLLEKKLYFLIGLIFKIKG